MSHTLPWRTGRWSELLCNDGLTPEDPASVRAPGPPPAAASCKPGIALARCRAGSPVRCIAHAACQSTRGRECQDAHAMQPPDHKQAGQQLAIMDPAAGASRSLPEQH